MRLLFAIDTLDYIENGTVFSRPSARAIIIKENKIAMIHSLTYGYYKFPGGGIKHDENHIDALIREVKEEAGLIVIPYSVKEYGLVTRRQKGSEEDLFIQDNYYYFCEVENIIEKQELDKYEEEAMFTLEFIDPIIAININNSIDSNDVDNIMVNREARVLQLLIDEGYFK